MQNTLSVFHLFAVIIGCVSVSLTILAQAALGPDTLDAKSRGLILRGVAIVLLTAGSLTATMFANSFTAIIGLIGAALLYLKQQKVLGSRWLQPRMRLLVIPFLLAASLSLGVLFHDQLLFYVCINALATAKHLNFVRARHREFVINYRLLTGRLVRLETERWNLRVVSQKPVSRDDKWSKSG